MMKKNLIALACLMALVGACSKKEEAPAVSAPVETMEMKDMASEPTLDDSQMTDMPETTEEVVEEVAE